MSRTKRTKDKKNNNNKITKTGFYLPPNLLGCILKKLSFRGNTAEKEDKSDMVLMTWQWYCSSVTVSMYYLVPLLGVTFVWHLSTQPRAVMVFIYLFKGAYIDAIAGNPQVLPKFKRMSWETLKCSVEPTRTAESGDYSLWVHRHKRPFIVFMSICDPDVSQPGNLHILWSQRFDHQSYLCFECCSVWHTGICTSGTISRLLELWVLFFHKKVHQTFESLKSTY